MLKVKNSNPNTIAVGLGGWSGEHLVNPYPDSFVIRFDFRDSVVMHKYMYIYIYIYKVL